MKKAGIGFKGKYFTLAAIQGLHTQIKIATINYSRKHLNHPLKILLSKDEDPPPDNEFLLLNCQEDSLKKFPCHCNCYFKKVTRLVLFFSKLLGRFHCPCRKTNTGIAPPLALFIQL